MENIKILFKDAVDQNAYISAEIIEDENEDFLEIFTNEEHNKGIIWLDKTTATAFVKHLQELLNDIYKPTK